MKRPNEGLSGGREGLVGRPQQGWLAGWLTAASLAKSHPGQGGLCQALRGRFHLFHMYIQHTHAVVACLGSFSPSFLQLAQTHNNASVESFPQPSV